MGAVPFADDHESDIVGVARRHLEPSIAALDVELRPARGGRDERVPGPQTSQDGCCVRIRAGLSGVEVVGVEVVGAMTEP